MKPSSLVVSLLLVLSGCKEGDAADEEGGTTPVENVNVLGAWKLDAQSWKTCTKPGDNLEESNLCSASTCFTYLFEPGGLFTYTIKLNDITTEKTGTYTVVGDQLTICITACSIPVTVARSAGTLTLDYVDSTTGCSVSKTYKQ